MIQGDFASSYTVKVSTSLEADPARGQQASKRDMTIRARWLGPCKPGQKPGDIEMPNGIKMNILDLPGGAPARK